MILLGPGSAATGLNAILPVRGPGQVACRPAGGTLTSVARLYAATGDGIARLDETADGWRAELTLQGSGAQCLAVDPGDAGVVYAGLVEGGVRRTSDGGRTWTDCAVPEPGVFSLAVSAADGTVYAGT